MSLCIHLKEKNKKGRKSFPESTEVRHIMLLLNSDQSIHKD